ncbi:uncharacterized protein LOC131690571 isoform X2 [Topomyia yanbarensis]|uniref:uncharacterized protein LOC131690571 isoform X2 n=1 Tax=Topomyia yanbarensis TaxID=2498891 RepID=UPI00273B37D3|nr:uncharacterized protein LOC131690571 isoform X2 [Topomyia yanbarensis]
MSDDSKLLEDAIYELSQLDSNVTTLRKALTVYEAEASESAQLDVDIRLLETSSTVLCNSLDKAIRLVSPKITYDLHSRNQELESLRAYKRNSERSLKAQCEKIAKLESDLAVAKEQAIGQFESVSWIGSIMGAMLWKSCKQHESVKALIGTDSLKEFLGMANCVLSSFVSRQSNSNVLLLPESEDYKFLASLCGALTNLAAFPEGRAHLATEADGLLFANSLLHAVHLFRMPAGRLLKRMSLTFVYNICLEQNGARFVMEDENRLRNVIDCLDLVNSEDVLTLAVSLLMKLIKAAPEFETKATIARQIPKTIVKHMIDTNNPQLKETAAHLVELVEFDWMKAASDAGND